MTFAKRLRDGVHRGEITCSVRIWTRHHVKVGTATEWKKVRSKWIRSSRSVFRISPQHWRASRDSWASLICSRLRNTVKARISISFGSTSCLHAPSAQVSASQPEEGLLLIQTATCQANSFPREHYSQ